jgi:hypothetical protein
VTATDAARRPGSGPQKVAHALFWLTYLSWGFADEGWGFAKGMEASGRMDWEC